MLLDQLVPPGFSVGTQAADEDDPGRRHAGCKAPETRLAVAHLARVWEPDEGKERSDDNVWTWPLAERKRKAKECANLCCIANSVPAPCFNAGMDGIEALIAQRPACTVLYVTRFLFARCDVARATAGGASPPSRSAWRS
jgi:hypothetical protein